MKTIYEELLNRVNHGETFRIDFEQRNMWIGKNWIIINGKWDEERELGTENCEFDMMSIEALYHLYKYSTPSERNDAKRKRYFKALSVDELTDEQLIGGETREYAQAALEGWILCMILTGQLTWKQEWGNWYWQSKEDSDLIILRSWVEGK